MNSKGIYVMQHCSFLWISYFFGFYFKIEFNLFMYWFLASKKVTHVLC